MNGPAQDRRFRRQVWMTAAYVLLVAAGVFAAWQARTYWLLRHSRGQAAPAAPYETGAAGEQGPAAFSQPGEMIARPLAPSGLAPLDADPGELRPPPQARRISAFGGQALGLERQQARYECPLPAELIVRHYADLLKPQGYRLLRDATGSLGRREVLFAKGHATVNLALRKLSQDDKIVIVMLTVSRPANQPPGR